MPQYHINEDVQNKLSSSIIDSELTLEILHKYNSGDYDHIKPVTVKGFPPVDNETIINMTENIHYTFDSQMFEKNLKKYQINTDEIIPEETGNKTVSLNEKQLEIIGLQLMPLYSFGILNGGSATSYADSKKNRSFNNSLFDLLNEPFQKLSDISTDKAKGITPAFLNPDGTPGPSFIELKMRALLLNKCASLFQMTSYHTNDSILETYNKYRNSPYLKDLIEHTSVDICDAKTGIQPLLSAYTHSTKGRKKELFIKDDGELLALPGGHGQCFITLKEIFIELYKDGIRFISIGNVDNTGYTPDPVSLAILALSGKQAGFDFAYRTPVDVKGGILITDERERLNCADLGVAIDEKSIKKAEENGASILFNCATGLFNLEYLVDNIDRIIDSLPMRFSDQDKDAGKYSQGEQVTWEVIGILDDILIFAINKYERFLAAKTLMENLMTSGTKLDDPRYPTSDDESDDLQGTAKKLSAGLEKKLKTIYGLKLVNQQWLPLSISELERNIC